MSIFHTHVTIWTAGGWFLLNSGTALAAGGGSGNPWMDLLWKAVNFAVLIAILVFFTRKPLRNLFVGAAGKAKDMLEGNREEARSAEAELAEQKRNIAGLQAQLERMAEEVKEESTALKQRLTEEAHAQAERLKTQMQLQVEQEIGKARSELKRLLADEAVNLAEKMLKESLDDQGQSKLVDHTLARLESGS